MATENNDYSDDDYDVLSSSDDDDDDADFLMLAAAAYVVDNNRKRKSKKKQPRKKKMKRIQRYKSKPKISWEQFIAACPDRDLLRDLRMPYDDFMRLVDKLRPALAVDEEMAALRGGAIQPEFCLFLSIAYVSAARFNDIRRMAGISAASFYRIYPKTLKALIELDDPELAIKFPQTIDECKAAARAFRNKSTDGAIANCVGSVDGYLACTIPPRKSDDPNARSYFSGLYKRHGINIQAVCDAESRFIFFQLAGPGGMNDCVALCEKDEEGIALIDLIENLPNGFVVIGDAAYPCTEHLVSIFSGTERDSDPRYDDFNFYASQVRIRIEMAFGYMAGKWGILDRALKNDFDHLWLILMGIAKLHNYVINRRLAANSFDFEADYATTCAEVASQRPASNHAGDAAIRNQEPAPPRPEYQVQTSLIRLEMVDRVYNELGLRRPRRRRNE